MTTGPMAQCGACVRLRSPFDTDTLAGVDRSWCAAFPTGIPDVIFTNQVDHRTPYPGDNGLQWSPKSGATYPETPMILTAATGPAGSEPAGAMVALIPTQTWIDAAKLDELDGAVPVDETHLTVAFLGEADQLDDTTRATILASVEACAATMTPVDGDVFGVGYFNPLSDEPCAVLLVNGADLAECHTTVCADLHMCGVDLSGQHPTWIPHITAAYVDDPYVVADLIDRVGPVTFDRLRVAFGPDVTDFPLGGDTGNHDTATDPAAG